LGKKLVEKLMEWPARQIVHRVRQLDEVLQKCLAKDRAQRFASVAATRQALIPAIEQCPPLSPAGTASEAMSNEEATTGLLPA
jgi:hypothetical protein